MFSPLPNHSALTALKVCLVLGLLLLPFAISVAPSYALQTDPAPNGQADTPDDDFIILKQVQNPDGTTNVTVRVYTSPTAANAPNASYPMSQDTYITSGIPDGNYGAAGDLRIGYSTSGGQGAMRMLLQFNLSGIPSNAIVNNATIYVYQYGASGVSNMGFQAQYAVAPWNEYNATWNNANFLGGSTLPIGSFPSTLGWLAFNSTNLFQTWINGTEPNYGLIITGNEDPAANSSRYFYSSNSGTARPYVDINYTTGCAYTTAPTSSVNPLPATSPSTFVVSWTGTAYTPPGCAANGISSYVVWYQVNNGSFIKWLDGVTYTSAQFDAGSLGIANGSTVGFRSQAIDYYGNKTPAGNATAVTVINVPDTTPPTATINPLPQYTTATSFWVSWTGSDVGSGIAYYNVQYQFDGGAWQTLISNTSQTSFYLTNAETGVYGFRVQAVDRAGNVQAWPASAQASTTVLVNPLAVVQPFNPPILQSTAPVTKSFTVRWQGYTPPGTYLTSYTIQYRYDTGSGWTAWTLWPLSPFPASQTSASFNWFDLSLPDEATYQFQATAANNVGQPPYELPSQYWPIMIIDMQDRGSITYLPLISNNAP
jgi:hypothetical protein